MRNRVAPGGGGGSGDPNARGETRNVATVRPDGVRP